MKYNAVLDVSFTAEGAEPVTLEEVKNWCRIDVSDDDDLITDLIPAARGTIEAWINQSLVQRTVTALLKNQLGGQYLPYGPIIEVTSVTDEDGDALDSADYEFKGAKFQYLKTEFDDHVTVVYDAGYTTLPYKFKNAILCQVAFMYENRGDESPETDISKQARVILQSERRV